MMWVKQLHISFWLDMTQLCLLVVRPLSFGGLNELLCPT